MEKVTSESKYVSWFKHDCNAADDDKLKIVKAIYGRDGYAWFFMILELLTNKSDHKFNLNEEDAWIAICGQCWVNYSDAADLEKIRKFIDKACKIKLFVTDEFGNLYSEKHLERMAKIDEIRERNRESGRKGGYKKSEKYKEYLKKTAAEEQNDMSAFSAEQQLLVKKFTDFLTTDAPQVKLMKEPFTATQIIKLTEEYPGKWDNVKDVLLSMQNKVDLTEKNSSANLTCRKWLKNQNILPVKK